jgi:hypothetical protein
VPVEELATLAWAAVHGLAVLQRDAQLAGPDADVPDLTALLTRVGQALEALG